MAATPTDSWRSRTAAPTPPAGSSAFRTAPAPGKGRRGGGGVGGGGGRRPHTPSEAGGPDKPKPSRQNSSAGAPAAAGAKPAAKAPAAKAAASGAGGAKAAKAANGTTNGRSPSKTEHHSPPESEKRTTGRRRRPSQNKGGPRPESSASKFNPPPPLTEVPLREAAKPAAHDLPPHLAKNTPPHLAQSHALFESHLEEVVRHAREGLLSATPGSGFAPGTPGGDWAADDDADELPALDDWGVHIGGSDAGGGDKQEETKAEVSTSSTEGLKPDWKSGLKAFSGPETSLISPIIVDGLRALPDPTETIPVGDKGKAKDNGKATDPKGKAAASKPPALAKNSPEAKAKAARDAKADAKAAAAFFLRSAAFTSTANTPLPPPNTLYATNNNASSHPSLPIKPSAPIPAPVSRVHPAATPMRGRKDRQKEKEARDKERDEREAKAAEEGKPAEGEVKVTEEAKPADEVKVAEAPKTEEVKLEASKAAEAPKVEEQHAAEPSPKVADEAQAAVAQDPSTLGTHASEAVEASPSAPSQASASPSGGPSTPPQAQPLRNRSHTASRVVGNAPSPGHRASPSAPQRHARAHSAFQAGHMRTQSTPSPTHRVPAVRPVIASSALAGIARQLGGASPRTAAVASKQ
ncbi:hypothetical protein K525DRAFT_236046 [Schizophyllum commune Loenen D]|nr:hypothetical protein K525DRAFT_236046 [Schizophyllum commune Loenen D]